MNHDGVGEKRHFFLISKLRVSRVTFLHIIQTLTLTVDCVTSKVVTGCNITVQDETALRPLPVRFPFLVSKNLAESIVTRLAIPRGYGTK